MPEVDLFGDVIEKRSDIASEFREYLERSRDSGLITIGAAARYLGVSHQAVSDFVKRGRLQTYDFPALKLKGVSGDQVEALRRELASRQQVGGRGRKAGLAGQ